MNPKEKIIDFISDQRFPWFYPIHMWRSFTANRHPPRGKDITLAITFDVEVDYPTKENLTAPIFLEKVGPLLDHEKVKATFFVQGSLIPKLGRSLLSLSRGGHEIAVHGWQHNNWGKWAWFLSEKPLTTAEKERDLQKVLSLFKKYKLPKPKAFRSPYMNWRQDTFPLLEKYGFTIDSSWDSFRQSGNHVFHRGNLWEIPVSSLPTPEPQIKFGLPFTIFRPFNLASLLAMENKDLKEYIKAVQSPLVFLAHPWEFFPNERFSYAKAANWEKFHGFLSFFRSQYRPRFATMSDLVRKMREENGQPQ